MELKFTINAWEQNVFLSSNRTFMELKLPSSSPLSVSALSSNRTFMELK